MYNNLMHLFHYLFAVKMVVVTTLIIFSALVNCVICQSYAYDYGYVNTKQYSRKIMLKQGALQGIVVKPKINPALSPVEQYLGIPYAAPPVGELRFMPPGSAPSWFGTKYADMVGPVCPQKFPDTAKMDAVRKKQYQKLHEHLLNESEDCLYLNIYAPVQEVNRPYSKKYPVMVFIHGESFEWNSGNPYDGSVLAAYGKVIVVTLNFRLGILGFLKVGLEDNSRSNFGLVDQVAALLWVNENIAAFGGDPNSVTLFGHGTGAACISLLMLSPMVSKEGKPLFHRAILMSGTALSDWALASSSRQVTYQVAEALNCRADEELAACLRKKRLNEILEVVATTRNYTTTFGPIIDGLTIPNDPNKIMSTYNNFFKHFELMYGLTEVESVHLLDPIALNYGLLEKERDQKLREYLYTRCEYKPEIYLEHTLAAYTTKDNLNDQVFTGFTGLEPDRASLARDTLLDVLSDARTAAPIALTAKYHAAVNPQSYFYVFGHTTSSREFLRNKTTHGEELPYVFGVPLDGPKFHFADHYNNQERLFSEVVMTLWSNFAYSGDPNVRRRHDYLTLAQMDWKQYDIEWPEFDNRNQRYLYLAIPPEIRHHYRHKELIYWNEILPKMLSNVTNLQYYHPTKVPSHQTTTGFPFLSRHPSKNVPSWFPFGRGTSTEKFQRNDEVHYGIIKKKPDDGQVPSVVKKEYGTIITSQPQPQPPTKTSGTAMIVLICVGGVFLIINVILFVGLYYKCSRLKSRENGQKRNYDEAVDPCESSSEKRRKLEDDELDNGCGIMKMISRSSKSGDTYEAVKISDGGSSKYKLSRQMSASTIDPHTKVRDWIAHEISQRCSPKYIRKPREEMPLPPTSVNVKNDSVNTMHVRSDSKTTESYSTLGKSPTRPVSPADGELKPSNIPKPKAQKVSVAIDATPAARSPSILRQQPIELTKSLDYSNASSENVPIRRSATLDNFFERKPAGEDSSNQKVYDAPTIVKIEHHHAKSKSDPVQAGFSSGTVYASPGKKMKTFDPNNDVNVTSREEDDCITPLSPEESLLTIKRRNFPKVLPDYPDKQSLAQKRRSMPAASQLFMAIPENPSMSQPSSPTIRVSTKMPPTPPPRGCSTLGRKPTNTAPIQSPVMLAEEPPSPQEPEITCNNLYVGPLLPSKENRKIEFNPTTNVLDTQPIYDNLKQVKDEHHQQKEKKMEKFPKTIITTDPDKPIKKIDPKIIIKPTINRNTLDNKSRTIPRVTAKDNLEENVQSDEKKDETNEKNVDISSMSSSSRSGEEDSKPVVKVKTPSQIPKLVKNANVTKEGSSESSPSEESETGTVIKRV